MMGGYQCFNEKSYLLLVDISKDSQKRQEEMDIDGGNLDDDTIEREWWQITVLSSLPIQDGEKDGKQLLQSALEKLLQDFIEKHKDVYKHFITKKNNQEAKFYKDSIDKVMAKAEYTFTKAEVPSGKSDQLSSDQVIKLKTDIAEVMKNVPSTALAIMIRNWHAFRLENSGYWTALKNDSFMVDSSLLKEIIHPDTNV